MIDIYLKETLRSAYNVEKEGPARQFRLSSTSDDDIQRSIKMIQKIGHRR